jgi:hypothetical protein
MTIKEFFSYYAGPDREDIRVGIVLHKKENVAETEWIGMNISAEYNDVNTEKNDPLFIRDVLKDYGDCKVIGFSIVSPNNKHALKDKIYIWFSAQEV